MPSGVASVCGTSIARVNGAALCRICLRLRSSTFCGRSRQREEEGGSALFGRRAPNRAAVAFDDLLAGGEPQPGSFILSSRMQLFERLEYGFATFIGDADAVVGDGKQPPSIVMRDSRHMHLRTLGFTVFQAVADEIL